MTVDPKTRENKNQDFDEGLDVLNSAEKYQKGKELLYNNGFLILPDSSGLYAFHKVYVLSTPCLDDDEIEYPDEFKAWKELASDEERSRLMSVILDWLTYGESYEVLYKFWVPFIKPNKNKNSPLYMYTQLLISELGLQQKRNSGTPVNLYLTPNPVVSKDPLDRKTQKELAPIKWIPRKEWFPESLKELSIYDVLTIYPQIEADLLALIIGRAVVGRSNHLPPGYESPIIHTSRMAAFVIGEDPGLGKTTLFTHLFNALETVGYTVETFESFASKFNLGSVITSDIIYKDDMTDKEFKSLTESGVAKSVISGSGLVKVQDKGVDAYNVFPTATIFANFNNFNPRLTFGIDPGFAERAKNISTVREAELKDLEVSPLSYGSPDYRPFVHLDFLANKLGVSKRVLLLYFSRLCADLFLETLETRSGLEDKVDFLSQRLRLPFNKDSTSQFMSFILFSGLALGGVDNPMAEKIRRGRLKIQDINWDLFLGHSATMIKIFTKDKSLRTIFTESYSVDSENDYLHPYHGLRSVDQRSLHHWVNDAGIDHTSLSKTDPVLYLTKAFGYLRQNSGLPYTKDEVWLIKAMQKIEYYTPVIYEIHKEVKEKSGRRVWSYEEDYSTDF